MKKNAILIAGIMLVGGCATNQHGTRTTYSSNSSVSPSSDLTIGSSTELTQRNARGELIPPGDPSIAAQYDPSASGSFGSSTTGYGTYDSHTYGSRHSQETSVNDYHADSSRAGGSNEARGIARQGLPTEGAAHPLNPAFQADSSIRGGSMPARDREWNSSIGTEPNTTADTSTRADSSIRGGSNQARYHDQTSPNGTVAAQSTDRDDFGQSKSHNWTSDKSGSLRGSANWNASDDLLRDGSGSATTVVTPQSDVNVGSPATSQSGTGDSSIDANTSPRLEKNISGDYNDPSASLNSGRPTPPVSDTVVGANSTSGIDLFRNNRAQGVGSAATGEVDTQGSDPLAQRVKGTLTREATGTFGMARGDIARNVQISSQGSTVILRGTVPSQRAKDMLEVRAREIQGVQRVENQLTVQSEADPSVRDATVGHDLEDRTDTLQQINPK